jgi:hypothetical protein
MKRILVLCLFLASYSTFAQNTIADMVANSKSKPKGAGYNYFPDGSSEIYIHPQYLLNSNHAKKMALIINTDERRYIEFALKKFHQYGYEVYYFYDLTCTDCTDAKSVGEVLQKNGIEILVKISIHDGTLFFPTDNDAELEETNYNAKQNTKGSAANLKQTLQKVYIEYFDDHFGANSPYIIAKANGKRDNTDATWRLYRDNIDRLLYLIDKKERGK